MRIDRVLDFLNIRNSRCHGTIDGPPLRWQGDNFHPYHFHCTGCNVELTASAREVSFANSMFSFWFPTFFFSFFDFVREMKAFSKEISWKSRLFRSISPGSESARALSKRSEWTFLSAMSRPDEHPHMWRVQVQYLRYLEDTWRVLATWGLLELVSNNATISASHQVSPRRPIEERVVTALGKHWHIEHFACAKVGNISRYLITYINNYNLYQ